MIKLTRPGLLAPASQQLKVFQNIVDVEPDYESQIKVGKKEFKKKNTKTNLTFKVVRAKLLQMTNDKKRCHYCEDSVANQIEHLFPKDFFPDKCFLWKNYLFACGICNAQKNNKWAGIDPQTVAPEIYTRPKNKVGYVYVKPASTLVSAWIDPCLEDPLDYLFMDILGGTFLFTEIPPIGVLEYEKAKYTIKWLQLNTRDELRKARETAFENYCNRLKVYKSEKANGVLTAQKRIKIKSGIEQENHPTVWKEMKRQKDNVPQLGDLFSGISEVLRW